MIIKINDEWGLLTGDLDNARVCNDPEAKAFVHLKCFRKDKSYMENRDCMWNFTYRLRPSAIQRDCKKCEASIPVEVVDKVRFICGL